jgi:hypothetical protein
MLSSQILCLVLALVISYSLTSVVGDIKAQSACELEILSDTRCSPDQQKGGETGGAAGDDNVDESDKGDIESEIPSSLIVPFP